MRKIWFGLTLVLLLVGAGTASAQPQPPAAAPAKLLAVGGEDRVFGKSEAPITIIEYASLTCPHCRHFEIDVLPKLKEKWIDTGKVKLVLRDFPLDESALRAAMLARCMPPEKFYPFVETLFQTQEQWATARDPRAALERMAKLAGLGSKQAGECLNDKTVESRVLESRLIAARQLGVDSTPTFFVNGTKFTGEPTAEAFDKVLSSLPPKS